MSYNNIRYYFIVVFICILVGSSAAAAAESDSKSDKEVSNDVKHDIIPMDEKENNIFKKKVLFETFSKLFSNLPSPNSQDKQENAGYSEAEEREMQSGSKIQHRGQSGRYLNGKENIDEYPYKLGDPDHYENGNDKSKIHEGSRTTHRRPHNPHLRPREGFKPLENSSEESDDSEEHKNSTSGQPPNSDLPSEKDNLGNNGKDKYRRKSQHGEAGRRRFQGHSNPIDYGDEYLESDRSGQRGEGGSYKRRGFHRSYQSRHSPRFYYRRRSSRHH